MLMKEYVLSLKEKTTTSVYLVSNYTLTPSKSLTSLMPDPLNTFFGQFWVYDY